MAEGKASFVLYTDLIHMVRKLPKETRGDLLLIILEYVNDNLSTVEAMEQVDILLSVTFEPIKQQLKRDLKKYEKRQQQRVDAGKRSAAARAAQRNSTTVDDSSISSGVSVSGNVNVSGNVIPKGIDYREREETSKNFELNYFKNLDETYNAILTDQPWLEVICMNYHLASIELGRQYVSLFFRKLQNEGAAQKSIADFKSHFARWLNLELKKQQKEKHGTKKNTGLATEAEQFEFLDAIARGIFSAQSQSN